MKHATYNVKADECFPEFVLHFIDESELCEVQSEISYNELDATWILTVTPMYGDDDFGEFCTELEDLFEEYGFVIV